MTLITRIEAAGPEDINGLLRELSDLQTWCACMAAKDSGGMPAYDLIQRTRIALIALKPLASAALKAHAPKGGE